MLLGTLKNFIEKCEERKKISRGRSRKTSLSSLYRNTDIKFDKASLYEYTREWVDRVNRGGLIEVADDFFLLIKLIELEC